MLSKKEKGRLKKLHSKSTPPNNSNSGASVGLVTGIQTNEDAMEYRSLSSKKVQQQQQQEKQQQSTTSFVPNGPSIHLRSSNKHKKCSGNDHGNDGNTFAVPRITEGDDHRNILHGLLFHTASDPKCNSNKNNSKVNKKKNKKRKRHESSNSSDNDVDNDRKSSANCENENHPCESDNDMKEKQIEAELEPQSLPVNNLPSWVVVHNPALIERIAVIEFNICSKKVGGSSSSASSSSCSNTGKTLFEGLENQGEKTGTSVNGSVNTNTITDNAANKNTHLSQPILNSKVLARMVLQNENNDSETTSTSAQPQALYTKVRLFQHDNNNNNNKSNKKGPRPRNITNVLMYSERKQYKMQRQQQQEENGKKQQSIEKRGKESKVSVDGLYSNLEKLVLSRTQMKKEGYPLLQQQQTKPIQDCHASYISAEEEKDEIQKEWKEEERAKCITEQNKCKEQLKQDAIKIHEHLRQQSHGGDEKKRHKADMDWNTMKSHPSISQAETVVRSLELPCYNGTSSLEDDSNGDTERGIFVATFLQRKDLLFRSKPYPAIYALDCEMVRTSLGLELARISLIQLQPTEEDLEGYTVILDSYVKPKNTILDYITEYSGISPKILKGVGTTLEEIQAILLALICEDDILIGHSLENDLNALRLKHEKVIDTAVVFKNLSDGRKHSLKHLSLCLLQRKIQHGQCGHNSVEDALASLLLAVRRATLGDKFMIYDKKNHKQNLMAILTRIRRQEHPHKQPLFFQRNGGPFICLGPNEWVKEHVGGRDQSAANVLQCENINSSSIRAITSYLRQGARSASMLWARICVDPQADKEYDTKMDSLLSNVIGASSINSVILIIIQVGYDEAKNLYKQRIAAKDPRSTLGWSQRQEDKYLVALDRSRYCDAYWIVPKEEENVSNQ